MKANPLRGAITRACIDAEFRARLIENPSAALAEEGIEIPWDVEVVVHQPAEDTIMFVLPDERTEQIGRAEHVPAQGAVADVPAGLAMEWRGLELECTGRIDGATAPALRRELLKRFSNTWVRLEGVAFLSSAGIAALLAAHKHLTDHNATLYLHIVPEPVRNVLELVGMADAFEIIEPAPIVPRMDTFGYPLV